MSAGEQKAYPSQFEKVKAITDQLEAGIQSLFESDTFKPAELKKSLIL